MLLTARQLKTRRLILPVLALHRWLLLGAVALLALFSAMPPRGALALGLRASCQRSDLILLQGLGTQYSDAPPYFADILAALKGQVTYANYSYFSYNADNSQNYSYQDSVQSLSRGVEALHRTMSREISQCDGVTVDLVGHSMGGLVALRYLTTYGPNTAEGSHVRHLVTLDSPLNGVSQTQLASLAQTATLFGVDISGVVASDAVRDLVAIYNNPATPQQNLSTARALSGSIVIGTLGSDDDMIVPYASSVIAGYQSEFALGVVSNLCPTYADACVGHNQILHDPGAIARVVSLLQRPAGSAAPPAGGGTAPQQPPAVQPAAPQAAAPSGGDNAFCVDLGGFSVCISP
jgi:pimeloyl-ACP methyl ester carboxylesterase